MTAKAQLKLLNAGFIIIRKEEPAMKIKYKSREHPEWRTNSCGYTSKAALQKGIDHLLESPYVLEG